MFILGWDVKIPLRLKIPLESRPPVTNSWYLMSPLELAASYDVYLLLLTSEELLVLLVDHDPTGLVSINV